MVSAQAAEDSSRWARRGLYSLFVFNEVIEYEAIYTKNLAP